MSQARVRTKPGVQFSRIAPAGIRLLEAIKRTAAALDLDLTITCACEAHPDEDPHTLGEAYDVRSHGLTPEQKAAVLRAVMLDLQRGAMDAPIETSGGMATMHFFGFIEAEGTTNQHFHFQRRKGTVYTIADYLAA